MVLGGVKECDAVTAVGLGRVMLLLMLKECDAATAVGRGGVKECDAATAVGLGGVKECDAACHQEFYLLSEREILQPLSNPEGF